MSGQSSVLSRRSRATAARRWVQRLPGPMLHERHLLVLTLTVTMALLCAVAGVLWTAIFPLTAFLIPVVVAGLFLPLRSIKAVFPLVLATFVIAMRRNGFAPLREVMIVGSVLVVMSLMYLVARSRHRLGLSAFHSDTMLVDLRDRLANSNVIPPLPAGWTASTAVHSAHGDSFAGDFLVAGINRFDGRLEVAVVDVSGKGREAGTRSLLLSGAFGGLIGSIPSTEFLAACNDYLIRQDWDEGFATAVHLAVDLHTGDYEIASAGHPPAAVWSAGSGDWSVVRGGRGPLLGVMKGLRFPRVTGQLAREDQLLLYTDGVIEARLHDIEDGVDRMLGAAHGAIISGLDIPEAVCSAARAGVDDDRLAVSIRRSVAP